MYVKVTNRRKVPVYVLDTPIPGKSSHVFNNCMGRIKELEKARRSGDIVYYEVNADGSSGVTSISRSKRRAKVEAAAATSTNSEVKESE